MGGWSTNEGLTEQGGHCGKASWDPLATSAKALGWAYNTVSKGQAKPQSGQALSLLGTSSYKSSPAGLWYFSFPVYAGTQEPSLLLEKAMPVKTNI